MSETIQCIDHGGWFEITLNRPDRLNSFNEDMHLALRDMSDTIHVALRGMSDTIHLVRGHV